jgi:uncharacterized protein (DUF433 family)
MTDNERITQHIELNPRRPDIANARLKEYGVAVWALIGYLRAARGDMERVARDYDIPIEAVEAAISYYRLHKAIIDDLLYSDTPDRLLPAA